MKRGTGIYSANVINLALEAKYSGDYTMMGCIWGVNPVIDVKMCTFTYNGIHYGGLEIVYNGASPENIVFNGETNFGIFGLDFYNFQSQTILNEEIYNSISYDKIAYTPSNYFMFNNKKILTEDTLSVYTFTKNLNLAEEYVNTEIIGSDIPTGTYALQLKLNDGPIYSGIIGWDNSKSFLINNSYEIQLNGLGYGNPYIVTLKMESTPNTNISLYIKSSIQIGNNTSCEFKFRKII